MTLNLTRRQLDLGTLSAFQRNPRRGNVDAIAASLATTGQYRSIVVNEGTWTGRPLEVLAGNHTMLAARQLGWATITADVVDVDEQTAARIVAADNRLADLGSYDDADLVALLASLDDLTGTGYTDEDLAALVDHEPPAATYDLEQADAVPDLPEEPRTKLGDLWLLGEHRVLCADATDARAIAALYPDGDRADVMWTDPPYGVDYVGGTGLTIQGDDGAGLERLLNAAFPLARRALRPGAPVYVAHSDTRRVTFEAALRAAGYDLRQNLVWVKNALVLGRSDYQYRHEPILEGQTPPEVEGEQFDAVAYGFTPGGKGRLGRGGPRWYGDNRTTTVFQVRKPKASREHPTMKPTELVVAMLRQSLPPRGDVFDPFAGSGSTLVAADMLGARASVIELDPRYVDVIVRRWASLRSAEPVLVRNIEEAP